MVGINAAVPIQEEPDAEAIARKARWILWQAVDNGLSISLPLLHIVR
jgi:hypothetical protein